MQSWQSERSRSRSCSGSSTVETPRRLRRRRAKAQTLAERSAVAAQQSADSTARSAAEAKRSNELAIEAAELQRFVWWIDVIPGVLTPCNLRQG
jgi:hypothetical protein